MAKHKYNEIRPGEEVGGGYFVFCRHRSSGRIAINPKGMPFEHNSLEHATAEAERLAKKYPGRPFVVVCQMGDAKIEALAGGSTEAMADRP